jgi:hypothetical protein
LKELLCKDRYHVEVWNTPQVATVAGCSQYSLLIIVTHSLQQAEYDALKLRLPGITIFCTQALNTASFSGRVIANIIWRARATVETLNAKPLEPVLRRHSWQVLSLFQPSYQDQGYSFSLTNKSTNSGLVSGFNAIVSRLL